MMKCRREPLHGVTDKDDGNDDANQCASADERNDIKDKMDSNGKSENDCENVCGDGSEENDDKDDEEDDNGGYLKIEFQRITKPPQKQRSWEKSSLTLSDIRSNHTPSHDSHGSNGSHGSSSDFFLKDFSSSSGMSGGGSGHRMRGSIRKRTKQRLSHDSTGDLHDAESFMSLSSFTSMSSMTSEPDRAVQVGNLQFVSDGEVGEALAANRAEATFDEALEKGAEDPPLSAILGQGAFATVRLAWRKTPANNPKRNNPFISEDYSLTGQDQNDTEENERTPSNVPPRGDYPSRPRRRSIVRIDAHAQNDQQDRGELVAVKIIQKSILKQMKTMHKDSNNRVTVRTAFDNIEREIATMKRLRHPNLVRLFEVIDSAESDRLYMVLEFVSLGEILSYVEGTDRYQRKRRGNVEGLTPMGYFDEIHAALYCVDILHGLAYLHRNRICHRDLKPENILLGANGMAKISDFGVAHMFENELGVSHRFSGFSMEDSITDFNSDHEEDEEYSLNGDQDEEDGTYQQARLTRHDTDSALIMSSMFDRGLLNKTEGTWCFWSPEMCDADSKVFSGYSADLWAAGVCLYIFATGRLPFFSQIPTTLFDLISRGEVNYENLGLSHSLRDLLEKMLKKDPSSRAGLGTCLQHEFLKKARMQRIQKHGKEFKKSDEDIVLTKDEVRMAFSITKLGGMFERMKKRLSGDHLLAVFEKDDQNSDSDLDVTVLTKAIKKLAGEKPNPSENSPNESKTGNGKESADGTTLLGRNNSSPSWRKVDKSVSTPNVSKDSANVKNIDSDSKTPLRSNEKNRRRSLLKRSPNDAECVIQ